MFLSKKKSKGEDADLLVELGYQLSLSGAFDAAMEAYQDGAKVNEGDVRAMTGVVYCQVLLCRECF